MSNEPLVKHINKLICLCYFVLICLKKFIFYFRIIRKSPFGQSYICKKGGECMRVKKVLCLFVLICFVMMLTTTISYARSSEETEEDPVRTSSQLYPYFDPYGFLGIPSVNPYTWQYPLYGGLNPLGYGLPMFGAQNLYYPMNLPGTNFVFQYPYMQIAPYIGATTFWQNQFPNADWNRVLASQFLGLINLPGIPSPLDYLL